MFIGHIQCPNTLLCSCRKLQALRKVFSACLRLLLFMCRCWWTSQKGSQVSFFLWGTLEEPNQTDGMNQRKIQALNRKEKASKGLFVLLTCHEDNLEAFSSKLCYYCISSPFLTWSRDIFWKHMDLKIPPWGNYYLSTFSEIQLSMQFIIITKGKNRCSFKGKGSTEGLSRWFHSYFSFIKNN